ncbi:exodeoxyribonuclease VII large subunit [uncultured Desulfuromonas sp.]|uniref:exodeoxyribonuclease VII large subunit n=1 Tax=uncultured Desulfuromonas sp. TaxID=181013 RepID=UPI00262620FB|nr:exodeoxyribonuclease VII large subunit [uncultured Desulfuromonas sp.]
MADATRILTVTRLNALLKDVIEDNFVSVLVEGEVSNWSAPASGHLYFSLKDGGGQLRAVMFRTQARLLRFLPQNGMQVICSGRVTLYPQRGEVQLVVDAIEPRGVGSLQVAFEQLKANLAAEGLFAEERKRPLPPYPRTIGVVTSATGAAIHDILNVLERRSAGVRVLLRPARVQGEGAAAEIAEAIADLNRQGDADVLIVGRGGGSLEDLWAFNEEIVVRAIHASAIPVIAAVGHEVDVSIADFVADLRAPTPSAAAELVVKSRLELEGHLDHLTLRLAGQMRGRLNLLRERVDGLARRLRSPRQQLVRCRERSAETARRLRQAMARGMREEEGRLAALCARLDSLSPLRTLARGYAVVLADKTGKAVSDASSLGAGDRLRIRFAKGRAAATVEEVEP